MAVSFVADGSEAGLLQQFGWRMVYTTPRCVAFLVYMCTVSICG